MLCRLCVIGLRIRNIHERGLHTLYACISEEYCNKLVDMYRSRKSSVLVDYMSVNDVPIILHGLDHLINKEHMGIDGWL